MADAIVADPVRPWPAARCSTSSGVEDRTSRIDQHLTDIMLAQDFHDLTGQVVAKVVTRERPLRTARQAAGASGAARAARRWTRASCRAPWSIPKAHRRGGRPGAKWTTAGESRVLSFALRRQTRRVRVVCFFFGSLARPMPGVPPGGVGNFLLSCQKKSPKKSASMQSASR